MATESAAGLLLPVSELFYSIQGESTYAGYPCLFIRLAGCNLRCSYCDARYSYEEEAHSRSLAQLLAFCDERPGALVQITGGEPLLHEAVYPLMAELVRRRRLVLLETNGSIDLGRVPEGVVKVMDLKCPDSGMERHMRLENLACLLPGDELKCVLGSRRDYDWAREMLARHLPLFSAADALRRRPKVLFSAVSGLLPLERLAQWVLDDGLPVRLQPQLHKILWPLVNRGK